MPTSLIPTPQIPIVLILAYCIPYAITNTDTNILNTNMAATSILDTYWFFDTNMTETNIPDSRGPDISISDTINLSTNNPNANTTDTTEIVSEYDQEISQTQTADKPVAS